MPVRTAAYVHTPFCAIKCAYCSFFSHEREAGHAHGAAEQVERGDPGGLAVARAEDDDVALHALQAYRRIAGTSAALERATEVVRERPGTRSAEQADRQASKLAKALAR